MLAPLVPHLAEELWHRLGGEGSVTLAPFPVADPAWLTADVVELPVQVNGKVRGRITVAADAPEDEVFAAAAAEPNVVAHLDGATVRKRIHVPGRLVNFVVS
jgi:leucyl-tRNA synthetase